MKGHSSQQHALLASQRPRSGNKIVLMTRSVWEDIGGGCLSEQYESKMLDCSAPLELDEKELVIFTVCIDLSLLQQKALTQKAHIQAHEDTYTADTPFRT